MPKQQIESLTPYERAESLENAVAETLRYGGDGWARDPTYWDANWPTEYVAAQDGVIGTFRLEDVRIIHFGDSQRTFLLIHDIKSAERRSLELQLDEEANQRFSILPIVGQIAVNRPAQAEVVSYLAPVQQ